MHAKLSKRARKKLYAIICPKDNHLWVVQTMNKLGVKFPKWMPSRNQTYQSANNLFYCNVQLQPAHRQTPFFRDEYSAHKMPFLGHKIKIFRRPNILQQDIEDFTASKMMVLQYHAEEPETIVISLQETHCTRAERPVIVNFEQTGSSLSRKYGLAAKLDFMQSVSPFSVHRTLNGCAWMVMNMKSSTFTNFINATANI